jgi:hypothetical protein
MGFLVSPGVDVNEIDLTNVIPAVSTSIGGFAGPFRWGPVEETQLVSSEKELASVFGTPNAFYAESFFTASSFLKYGNSLKAVRTTSSQLLNAVSGSVVVNTGGIASVSLANPLAVGLTSDVSLTVNGTGTNAALSAGYTVDSVTINTEGSDFDSLAIIEGETLTVDLGGGSVVTLLVGAVDLVEDPNTIVLTVSSSDTITSIPASVTDLPTINVEDSPAVALNDLTVDLTFAVSSVVVDTAGADYALASTTISVNDTEVTAAGNYTLVEATDNVSNGLLIKNETHFESGITLQGNLYARYAGTLGNSIQVDVFNTEGFNAGRVLIDDGNGNQVRTEPLTDAFDGAPEANEYHIIITDSDGGLTETAGTILETWAFVGTTEGAKKEDGSNNYYVDLINQNSNYIYVGSAVAAGTHSFTQGTDQTSVVEGDITSGIDLFSDAETVDVNLLFAYNDDNSSDTIAEHLIATAKARKDIVAFCSPPIEDSTGNAPLTDVKEWCDGITTTSYAVLDSTAIYTYNKYADKYIWIPACGHIAGLCANTDDVAEPWFSPAGYNRGQLLGATKLAYNPKQADRDELYKSRINPIVSFPGQGTLLFGDKTAQSKPSAFDRINVRRLFIVLEKAIATAAKYQLFELNDEFTRSMFRNMTEPFLRDVKGRRGVTDFLVVCDETNNTGQVIDANRFVADIYIKPARSINFITLNFIATRTGVEFSEIVGTN